MAINPVNKSLRKLAKDTGIITDAQLSGSPFSDISFRNIIENGSHRGDGTTVGTDEPLFIQFHGDIDATQTQLGVDSNGDGIPNTMISGVDQIDIAGCFSGTCVTYDNFLYHMYFTTYGSRFYSHIVRPDNFSWVEGAGAFGWTHTELTGSSGGVNTNFSSSVSFQHTVTSVEGSFVDLGSSIGIYKSHFNSDTTTTNQVQYCSFDRAGGGGGG